MALRPHRRCGRGLLSPPAAPGDRARRGGAPVPGRCDHRRARQGRRPHRAPAARARVPIRAPCARGDIMTANGATARGTVAGLASPHSLAAALPALYQEDDRASTHPNMAQRFTSAFDELLAPVFLCLDNVDAYLDPMLAPPDFVDWLAGWLGLDLDENWPLERR